MKISNYSLKVKDRVLLDNVSIELKQGEVTHLLGSNGVGKSCFAKSLIGVLPYTGSISPVIHPVVVGSYSNVPGDLTLTDLIRYLKKINGNDKVEMYLDLLNLNHAISYKTTIRNLSDGQKQKVKLMFFLIDEPDFVLLDEFTTAIDKKSTLEIYEFLTKHVKAKNIFCLNITHNLADIQNMAGAYYYMGNQTISHIETSQEIIDIYVQGGI